MDKHPRSNTSKKPTVVIVTCKGCNRSKRVVLRDVGNAARLCCGVCK